MSRFTISRTNKTMPDQKALAGARELLFGALDGFGEDDKKAWRKLWKRLVGLEHGEMVEIQMTFPRSGAFHRRHMALEQKVFDCQDKFDNLDSFLIWTKIGAGWVIWAAGVEGGLIPIPKSISYAQADEMEFRKFHEAVIRFFRSEHFASFLWPHLGNRAHEQIDWILREFGE